MVAYMQVNDDDITVVGHRELYKYSLSFSALAGVYMIQCCTHAF